MRSASDDEPFVAVEPGFNPGSLVTTDTGFLSTDNFGGGIWASPDGVNWERAAGPLPGWGTVAGQGKHIAFLDWSTPVPRVRVSDDGGVTWASWDVPGETAAISSLAYGPAGLVLYSLDVEVMDEPESTELEKDGYRIVLGDNADLYDAETGELIMSIPEEEGMTGSARVENLGNAFRFLDPDTGEVLVTITEADITAALVPQGSDRIVFTADGVRWDDLELEGLLGPRATTPSYPFAVGDAQVVVGLSPTVGDAPLLVGTVLDE
jgi:hypothetical protein